MLPQSYNFLLKARDLALEQNYDKLQILIVKHIGEEDQWHQKLKPLLSKLNIRTGVLQNRTAFIRQILTTQSTERLITLTRELLKHKAIQETHLMHFNLAVLYDQINQNHKALFSYQMCLKLKPSFLPAVCNYVKILKKQNRADQALYYLENWIKYYSTPNYKIQLLYLTLCKQEHKDRVYRMFKAKKLHPYVQYNLAIYLKRSGLIKQAISFLSSINYQPLRHLVQKQIADNYSALQQKQNFSQPHQITQPKKLQQLHNYNELNQNQQVTISNQYKLRDLLEKKKQLNNFYSSAQYYPGEIQLQNNHEIFQQKNNKNVKTAMNFRAYLPKASHNVISIPSKSTKLLLSNKTKRISHDNSKNFLQVKQKISSQVVNPYIQSQLKLKKKQRGFNIKQNKYTSRSRKEKNHTFQPAIQKPNAKTYQNKTQKTVIQEDQEKKSEKKQEKKQEKGKQLIQKKLKRQVTKGNVQIQRPIQKLNQKTNLELNKQQKITTKQPIKSEQQKEQATKKRQAYENNIRNELSSMKTSISPQNKGVQQSQKLIQMLFDPEVQDNKKQHMEKLSQSQKIKKEQTQEAKINISINNKPHIFPLKKKVSYSEILVTSLDDRRSENVLLSKHSKQSGSIGTNKQTQPKQQVKQIPLISNLKPQNSQPSSIKDMDNHEQSSSDKEQGMSPIKPLPRNNSIPTPLMKKSILVVKPNKLSTIIPQSSIISNLKTKQQNKINAGDTSAQQSFHLSSNSNDSSQIIESKQYKQPTERHIKKENEIKKVVEQVMKIRQSVDIGEITIHAYMNQKICQSINLCKAQYKSSNNHEEKLSLLLKIGELFQKDNNAEAAAKTYEKCIKSQSPYGFLRMGQLQLNKGEIAMAIQNLQKAYHFFRNDVRLKLKLAYGYSLFSQGLQKAVSITNSILLSDPTNLQAILLSSNIYQKQGHTSIALQIISAVNQQLVNQSIKHYMGLLHLQDSNIEEAYQYFRQALKINHKYVPSLIECATILSTNQPIQAIKLFKKVLKSQNQNKTALGRLAKIYQSQQQYQKAIELYKSLITLVQSYGIYQSLGFCQMKVKSYNNAIQHFKKAITFESNVFCWNKIAECYEIMRQYDKALNYYEMTIKMTPTALVFRKIGICMINLQNFKGAIRNLKHSLDIQETIQAYSMIANCHYLVGQYDEAIAYYKKAACIKGYDAGVYYNMAICYDHKQQFIKSKPLYEKILDEDPNNIKCLFNLANILLIFGKSDDALLLFEKGLHNDPKNWKRRLQIIQLYEILNNLDKAQSHLQYCFNQDDEDISIVQSLLRISRKQKDIKKVNHYTKILQDLKIKINTVLPRKSSIDKT